MKRFLIAVLVLSVLGVSLEAYAEQKIIFCGDTSSYQKSYQYDDDGRRQCNNFCALKTKNCGLNDLLAEGWKIDANMVKTIPMELPPVPQSMESSDFVKYVNEFMFSGTCSCSGTQLVLSKDEKKIEVAPESDKNLELMKKEIELLKKENDMLRKDGEALNLENEALKKKATKKK